MSKPIDNIKKIWKKTLIEVTNEVFDDVIKTASEESAKPAIEPSNIIACMSMVRDKMEHKLKENGLDEEDTIKLKKHQEEWVKESMPWMMDLIMDRLNIKETIIKKGN